MTEHQTSRTAINPIRVVDQVIDEYRSYLLTEFRARDPKLRAALVEALERPLFLAQEPFFQAHRPFKEGLAWRDLGLDAKLAETMERRSESKTAFLHQSDSITHLLSPEAGPLAVTTGTGSGKTECFLLPVLQNAIEDSVRFKQSGITAILVYPMNALANDQELRINDYLAGAGRGDISVARYDRQTKEDQRAALRKNPPHILLTNYMMLEYLLVRPADREALFANHRCRFVVLDEVHTYRGALGANIALLFRRLRAHLAQARQDLAAPDPNDARRFPKLVPVATSATIKSAAEGDVTPEERRRQRNEAVAGFLAKLTGIDAGSIRVVGEELRDVPAPEGVAWPDRAYASWLLGDLLARKPLSPTQIVDHVLANAPGATGSEPGAVRQQIEKALLEGSALPDGPGSLRLRTHRLIRGGWRFHRCLAPECGRLYAMGEGVCSCGRATAPLLICRSCGADALHLVGAKDPEAAALQPRTGVTEGVEWILYDRSQQDTSGDEEEEPEAAAAPRGRRVEQMKERPVVDGSFDPDTSGFSRTGSLYRQKVTLAPARNRCLVCGASAGNGSILTPVALGTSAAVRVVAEGLVEGLADEHRTAKPPGYDGKERLLVFADSRQDAAHQARFITYAGRYDRMRRRLVRLVSDAPAGLTIGEAVQRLTARGVERRDNPKVGKVASLAYLPESVQRKARAWEEAPVLDDLALGAAYRATVINLGLVGVRYEKLGELLDGEGRILAKDLGVTTRQLAHVARCLLDEMRGRGALSRPMLTYHPLNPSCPDEYREADWERRIKKPRGYACDASGRPTAFLEEAKLPEGVGVNNLWRRPGRGGGPPRMQKTFTHLLGRMGGRLPEAEDLLRLLDLLSPIFVCPVKLQGFKKAIDLLQVNDEAVLLACPAPAERHRCSVCNVTMPWVETDAPCPRCEGVLKAWPAEEVDANRYVQRIRKDDVLPLVAGEHTAQVTGEDRIILEEAFKAKPEVSPLNVLACSPTLEMGIDVGGLDAVLMRNVPPRPDNYAQRGGRAGRRSRVGIVLGYARNTPHDQYFFDKPAEMIAGEVAAPGVGLGNRDVVVRHLNAIALGEAEPGLKGRMGEYITLQGELKQDAVDEFVSAFENRFDAAADLALMAFGEDVLAPAGLETREKLLETLAAQPARIRTLFDRVRLQIIELQQRIDQWATLGQGTWSAINAMTLKKRLLGLPDREGGKERGEADDRGGGHPMRRFAEFGLLPGYEFPSEPATLRLLRDEHEEEPITVVRRFGLAQYQPDAPAHARGHRWRVAGLDMASPWNPRTDEPQWPYVICGACSLRFGAEAHVECPRCGKAREAGRALPGWEFGGFLAVRDDKPIADEEDRFALASLLRVHPQWNGDVLGRFRLPTGWAAELRREEDVRWVNESAPPTKADLAKGTPLLHSEARGFFLCSSCGRILTPPEGEGDDKKSKKGHKEPKSGSEDPFGHASGCKNVGKAPQPLAIVAVTKASTLRFLVDLPLDMDETAYSRWGLSLGYALRSGMRLQYTLDGPEIEFELEPLWKMNRDGRQWKRGSLTFIDTAVGGSGFLEKAASELHLVAARTLDHLDHKGCDEACYRCLKSYQNQRFHSRLSWPHIIEHVEALATAAPEPMPGALGDVLDPSPWLEAYDAGVGSPLELKFLRLFEKHGLAVENQVPVAPKEGGKPISLADFVVKGKRIAIYIDGACFHTGMNLRRDRRIREKLQAGEPPWRVVELRAKDLGRGADLVKEILALEP
jgi:hypothetical protein